MQQFIKPLFLALFLVTGATQAALCSNPVLGNVIFQIDTNPDPLYRTDPAHTGGLNTSVQQLCVTSQDASGYHFSNFFDLNNPTSIVMSGTLSTNGFINWTVDALNFRANTTRFFADIILPLTSGPFSSVTSSLTGSVIDQRGDGVFAFGLNAHLGLNFVNQSDLDLGPGQGNLGCEFGVGVAGTSYACGAFGPASKALSQSYTGFDSSIGFDLSGNADTATFNGTVALVKSNVNVPEPDGLALMALGLVLATLARRKQGAGRGESNTGDMT